MIDYKKRSLKKELLDQDNIPFEDIVLNMKELDFINSHLGGHSITIKGFKTLSQNRKVISVCEIGCGGGDNLKAIDIFCRRKHIISCPKSGRLPDLIFQAEMTRSNGDTVRQGSFTGIDINKDCITFAKENSQIENANFIVSDFKNVDFKNDKPDIIFSSLFCHHFSDDELIEMLHWMKSNSSVGFFINDLHRHPIAYYFIKIATRIFSKSYLVKNDAPLSVLRGFKRNEWKSIFKKAGIANYSIKWKWAFRYLIISQNHPWPLKGNTARMFQRNTENEKT